MEIQPLSFGNFSSLYRDATGHFASTVEAAVESLAQTWIPDKVVYRVSIFLMAVERIQDFLIERPMEVDIHWLLPVTTVVASFCFSLALIVQLQSSASDSAVMMVSLVLVELLVPLTMISSTTLCCLGALTGETAAILIACVWATAGCCSDYMRTIIYPNLGHDG